MSAELGRVDVLIERPATGGGVGRGPDGRVVFARNALPGERVRVSLSEITTTFSRGEVVDVLEPSIERVTPPCPYVHPGGCGGCDLMHASGAARAEWKAFLVREHLRRIAGVERDVRVEAARATEGSRTRLRCAVDDEGRLCLRAARTNNLVPIESCWISDGHFSEALTRRWSGAHEVELRAIGEGEPFAVVRTQSRDGVDVRSLAGAPLDPSTHSRARVDAHVYRVGPMSFWQSHRDAPEVLVDAVMEYADVSRGDHAADFYSGVGLFSVPLARRVGTAGRVVAVESSAHAVRDARANAEGISQLTSREWSVSPRAVNDAVRENALVVVDPPRQGLARGVVDALARRSPRRVVYVSCDAATFARDLKNFLGHGFALSDLRVFDLFPMTEHVELVANLDRPSYRVDSADGGT